MAGIDVITYALCKKYTNSKISELGSVLKFKGIVATVSALPTSNNKKGDVWIVSDTSSEYVWTSDTVSTGSDYWELLGAAIGTGKYTTTVTVDASHNVFNITHGLNTTDVVCLVYDTNGYEVIVDCQRTGLNTVTISFSNAATYGTYNVALIVPQGPTGAAGYSPSATVTKSGHTATVSITDKTGTTSTTITEPTATVNKVDTTATITITDVDGTHTATISDGEKGEPGDISDVQINSVSIKSGGTANIPLAGASTLGVVKAKSKTSTDTVEVSVDSAGKLYVPESGKVDDVKIGDTSLVTNKIATIPSATTSVVGVTQLNNTVTSTSTDQALTAKMGKELQDQISNLKNIGRFLAIWNCATGLPLTNPTTLPYTYKTGDYYRVGTVAAYTHTVTMSGISEESTSFDVSFSFTNDVSTTYTTVSDLSLALYAEGHSSHSGTCPATGSCGEWDIRFVASDSGTNILLQDSTTSAKGTVLNSATGITINDTVTGGTTNYKPEGTSYTGSASTTVETEDVEIGSVYYYDGTTWCLQKSSSGGKVQDVRINGTTILDLNSGIANIPVAGTSTLGVVKAIGGGYGVQIVDSVLRTVPASEAQIQSKIEGNMVIGPAKLDIAIREGLGNNSLTWTPAYQANARNTIGAGTPYTVTVNID